MSIVSKITLFGLKVLGNTFWHDNLSIVIYNNEAVFRSIYQKSPQPIRRFLLYRAYTTGVEELLIILMEMRDHPEDKTYLSDFDLFPKLYGADRSTLLPPRKLYQDAAEILKSGGNLDPIIQQLTMMLQTNWFFRHEKFLTKSHESKKS